MHECILSDHNKIKLNINKNYGKRTNTQKLNNPTVNDYCSKDKIN